VVTGPLSAQQHYAVYADHGRKGRRDVFPNIPPAGRARPRRYISSPSSSCLGIIAFLPVTVALFSQTGPSDFEGPHTNSVMLMIILSVCVVDR
jgi:hypothetical protein